MVIVVDTTTNGIMASATDSLFKTDEETKDTEDELVADAQRTSSRSGQLRQWLACISATLSMVAVGTVYGWITTILLRLNKDENIAFQVTDEEGSWIVSLTVLGSMVGPFFGAYISDSRGRKFCLLLSSLFYISGWILVIFAWSVEVLYVSRIILGIGVGMSYTINPMYVSEVADTNIRGALGTLTAVNVFTGSLLTCAIGPYVSYRTLGFTLLCIPLLFVLTFSWFPETAYFLAIKKRDEEAMRTIAFFKCVPFREENKCMLRKELNKLIKNVGNQDNLLDQNWRERMKQLFTVVGNRRALTIVIGLVVGQQLSGNFSTMQYLQRLFKDASIGINADVATIVVLAMGLVSGTLSTMTVEGAGRRLLLLTSAIMSAVTLGILATYLLVKNRGIDVSSMNLLPVVDVIIFQIVYQLGLGTLPNALIGELFPPNVKGMAGATITVSDGLLGFAVTKLYQVIRDVLGLHAVYFFFAGSCFVIFLFVFAFVPETRNKTFAEIQHMLNGKSLYVGFRARELRDRPDNISPS